MRRSYATLTGLRSSSAITAWYSAVGMFFRDASWCRRLSTVFVDFRFAIYTESSLVVLSRVRNSGSSLGIASE